MEEITGALHELHSQLKPATGGGGGGGGGGSSTQHTSSGETSRAFPDDSAYSTDSTHPNVL